MELPIPNDRGSLVKEKACIQDLVCEDTRIVTNVFVNDCGNGTITQFPIADGIFISFVDFKFESCFCKTVIGKSNIIQFDLCLEGSMEMMTDSFQFTLLPGDGLIHHIPQCDKKMLFPCKKYSGLTLSIDPNKLFKGFESTIPISNVKKKLLV